MKRLRLYWICQVVGWGTYVFLIAVFNKIKGIEFDLFTYINLASTFVIGVLTSHLYRNFIIRFDWLKQRIAQLIPKVLLASFVLAILFYAIHTLISDVVILQRVPGFDWIDVLQNLINLSANYLLWTLLYWSFHFIENYKKEEIKNLKWQANKNEMELNKIKSQLNPHFIFNSMNSIRALVDENPGKAKHLITQLSNILRSSLYMDQKPVIPFKEEVSLVRDYLDLEKARLESRLQYEINVHEDCYTYSVPPMLIQTLVENGIKHGINHLEEGGLLTLEAKILEPDTMKISIGNSGNLSKRNEERDGIGLKISEQRLLLLYGGRAKLELEQDGPLVRACVLIPKHIEKLNSHESTDR